MNGTHRGFFLLEYLYPRIASCPETIGKSCLNKQEIVNAKYLFRQIASDASIFSRIFNREVRRSRWWTFLIINRKECIWCLLTNCVRRNNNATHGTTRAITCPLGRRYANDSLIERGDLVYVTARYIVRSAKKNERGVPTARRYNETFNLWKNKPNILFIIFQARISTKELSYTCM